MRTKKDEGRKREDEGTNTQKKKKKVPRRKSEERTAKVGEKKVGERGKKMRMEIKTSDHGIGVQWCISYVLIATYESEK